MVWLKDLNGVYFDCNLWVVCLFGIVLVGVIGKIDGDFMLFEFVDWMW